MHADACVQGTPTLTGARPPLGSLFVALKRLHLRTIPSESLFVMGLPPGSTPETITAFFGQFAGVAFVKVLDTNGKKGGIRLRKLEKVLEKS